MPVKRVVIEAHLGVHRQQAFLAIFAGDDAERIDFDQARVAFPPRLVKTGKQLRTRRDQVALKAERDRQFAPLEGHQADSRVNDFAKNFLRMLRQRLVRCPRRLQCWP